LPVEVVAQFDLWYAVQDPVQLGNGHVTPQAVVFEFDEIQIGDIASVAVGHKKILASILVKVFGQSRPTPIGSIDTRPAGRFGKAIARIELEYVAHLLPTVAEIQQDLVSVQHHGAHEGFLALVGFGQHVQHHQIRSPILVEVCRIGAHGVLAGLGKALIGDVGESAIALVAVEHVGLDVIVGHENVGPAISCKVVDRNAQAKGGVDDAGLLADVRKSPAIVSEQSV
jgi:hypothetical protein